MTLTGTRPTGRGFCFVFLDRDLAVPQVRHEQEFAPFLFLRIVMSKTVNSTVSKILPSAGVLLAKRLRSWREQHDIPIKRAAYELGVSFATWDHWEKGRRFPTMDDLDLLAQYLRLPPCLLFCPFTCGQCGYCPDKKNSKASSTNCRNRIFGIPSIND